MSSRRIQIYPYEYDRFSSLVLIVSIFSLQFLYIQMEYCEKSTLRNIIDSGELFTDQKRIWKLFREIVEGLAYIHDTGAVRFAI